MSKLQRVAVVGIADEAASTYSRPYYRAYRYVYLMHMGSIYKA